LYKTHLWLGIISGIVLFVVCLTGTLLVFRWEIIEFFEPEHKHSISHPNMSLMKLEDIVTKLEQSEGGKTILVSLPDRRGDAMGVYIDGTEFKVYQIDPYTGEILKDVLESESTLKKFFHFIMSLHTSLFLPSPIGQIVVGSATLIFVIITLSGFCLWLPANFRNLKAWKNGFLIRFHKGKHSLILDLHKTLAFYALIPILLMALTGLVWSFQWYRNSVQMVFNAEPDSYDFQKLKSSPPNPDAKRLPLDFFYEKADKLIAPYHRGMYLPDREDATVMMMGWHQGYKGYDRIVFDQYTGDVLLLDQFDKFPIGKKIVKLYPFIHYGSAFG
jgi:uncharacterized iron-regulated membrane protein